ncbi:K+/H+ antiporter subunit F [Pseudoduganella sp. GCM10020061]|jgi:multicomponent K+:H+ antiporter subunit F|uniref:K+/H+ antiporter subunit F n=1 Tax=Pseudoduganella sp. GCM10020061 TaxID=3317345 RepID=UPI0036444AB9
MATLLEWTALYALVCVLVGMGCCALRLLVGPSAHDRVLALDTLWMSGMLLAIVLGIRYGTQVYFEFAMLIGLTGFVSTVALTKFLIRGEIIE